MTPDPQGRVAARLREVREAHVGADGNPMFQADFARLLHTRAQRMFGEHLEHKYSPSLVNRLENGIQPPTLQDVAVYAAVDPSHRGKLWLAWGETQDTSMRAGVEQLPASSFPEVETTRSRAAKRRGA